ncbi:hypothetical protein D3C77_631000 [compost metagenome]
MRVDITFGLLCNAVMSSGLTVLINACLEHCHEAYELFLELIQRFNRLVQVGELMLEVFFPTLLNVRR